jgi:hypothetical protein
MEKAEKKRERIKLKEKQELEKLLKKLKNKKEVRKLARDMKTLKCNNGLKMFFPNGFGVIKETGQILNPLVKKNKYGRRLRMSKKTRLKLRRMAEAEKAKIETKRSA